MRSSFWRCSLSPLVFTRDQLRFSPILLLRATTTQADNLAHLRIYFCGMNSYNVF